MPQKFQGRIDSYDSSTTRSIEGIRGMYSTVNGQCRCMSSGSLFSLVKSVMEDEANIIADTECILCQAESMVHTIAVYKSLFVKL